MKHVKFAADIYFVYGFDSTYEGLKHLALSARDWMTLGFDSTYEGLKLQRVNREDILRGVSTVPMRA